VRTDGRDALTDTWTVYDVLGKQHPSALMSMNNLAAVLSPCEPLAPNELQSSIAFELKSNFDLDPVSAIPVPVAVAVHSSRIRQPHGGERDTSTSTRAERDGTKQRASIHINEHEQPGDCAERSGELRGDRRDESTGTGRAGEGARGGVSRHVDQRRQSGGGASIPGEMHW
jgi:hypothetical protein